MIILIHEALRVEINKRFTKISIVRHWGHSVIIEFPGISLSFGNNKTIRPRWLSLYELSTDLHFIMAGAY